MLKTWAIVATALALVLLGIVIGRHTEPVPTVIAEAPVEYETDTQTSTEPGRSREVEVYRIPVQFNGIKSEWRSEVERAGLSGDEQLSGYSALFDPERRQVIVEECRHAGYFDQNTGKPIDGASVDFCTVIMKGRLTQLTERSAVVETGINESIDVSLELDQSDEQPQLSMVLNERRIELIPGSRNDLYQLMDVSPKIKAQKSLLYDYDQEQMNKRREAQQTTQNESADQVTRPRTE
ncbi:MAG: hypothetical protein AB8G18_18185 [Gammaproteobacteria bacterium]